MRQRTHVVRRAARDVQQPHAVACYVERQQTHVVFGHAVAVRRAELDAHQTPTSAVERERQLDGGQTVAHFGDALR